MNRSRMRKKRQLSQQCPLAFLGPMSLKAAHKMLIKLTPGSCEKITRRVLNINAAFYCIVVYTLFQALKNLSKGPFEIPNRTLS